ncbi:ATP-grasp domain-containing protein [Peribacillus kribbensis]|uniref:ATP-grasp domain-containing protein n=1 Tax=Peribacillus kribbensis TaxID=356658 RepID=UPI000402ED0A|nr:RimK family alpha-L-glutamate ligase [Peribacillus kribbensis]
MSLTGWLVFNGSLSSEKFMEQIEWLHREGLQMGMDFTKIPNHELIPAIEDGRAVIKGGYEGILPDFVFFWDKDIRLAYHLEKMGMKLFNSARSIEVCDDKSLTFQELADHGIKMPKTILAPKVFKGLKISGWESYHQIGRELGYPLIIKEVYGSFGAQVYLIENEDQLRSKVTELEDTPYIFQEYIASSFGRDVRLNVVGREVVAAMYRKSETDFRANVTAGGKMYPFTPTKEQKELAVRSAELAGTDFAGVDLLFGEEDEPILCEVNSNAHFKNIYDCTGVDVANKMLEYIANYLKGRMS